MVLRGLGREGLLVERVADGHSARPRGECQSITSRRRAKRDVAEQRECVATEQRTCGKLGGQPSNSTRT